MMHMSECVFYMHSSLWLSRVNCLTETQLNIKWDVSGWYSDGNYCPLKNWNAIIIVMVPNVWCKFFPQMFSYCSYFLFLIHIWLQFCDKKFPFCDTSSCFEIMDHYSVPGANCFWLFLLLLWSSDLQITHFRRDGIQVPEAEASVTSAGRHGGGSLLVARHDPQLHNLILVSCG